MFDYWTVLAEGRPEVERYLATWVGTYMTGYTGMLNFETIGARIIEVHMRFADQWPDLYGAGWVEALVRLYAAGSWEFDDATGATVTAWCCSAPTGSSTAIRRRTWSTSCARRAGVIQRPDHLPRRSPAGTALDAARRIPSRDRQLPATWRPGGSPRGAGAAFWTTQQLLVRRDESTCAEAA